VTEYRPGQRILTIPGGAVQVAVPRGAAAVAGWWEAGGAIGCLGAYQPIGAASYAASLVNLADPGTRDAYAGTSPSWDAVNGWTFNGSTQYLIADMTPATDQSWSVICRYVKTGGYGYLLGCRNFSDTRMFALQPNDGGAPSGSRYYNGGTLKVAPGAGAGIMGLAGATGYRGGAAEAGSIPAWTGSARYQIYFGAYNNGPAVGYYKGTIQCIAIYNTTLSAVQMAAITAAMAAL